MADRGWKQFERRISRDHGCERRPNTGERDGSDAMPHPIFALQMKLRKAIPKCIREWSDSIHRAAQRDGKIGVLVVKEPRLHDDNALVILRYRDWVSLHGSCAMAGLEEALRAYGQHKPDCEKWSRDYYGNGIELLDAKSCTCGFSALSREVKADEWP